MIAVHMSSSRSIWANWSFIWKRSTVTCANRTNALRLACCFAPRKDSEVVEYALSRALSPALVAEYQTKLPDKKLLQAKLHEFYELSRAAATEALPLPKAAKRKKAGKR